MNTHKSLTRIPIAIALAVLTGLLLGGCYDRPADVTVNNPTPSSNTTVVTPGSSQGPAGAAGPSGAAGAPGATGASGAAGASGPTGASGR